MSKVRLYHVAADWDVSAKELLTALESAGAKYKSHWVEIDADDVRKLRTRLESSGFFGGTEESDDSGQDAVVEATEIDVPEAVANEASPETAKTEKPQELVAAGAPSSERKPAASKTSTPPRATKSTQTAGTRSSGNSGANQRGPRSNDRGAARTQGSNRGTGSRTQGAGSRTQGTRGNDTRKRGDGRSTDRKDHGSRGGPGQKRGGFAPQSRDARVAAEIAKNKRAGAPGSSSETSKPGGSKKDRKTKEKARPAGSKSRRPGTTSNNSRGGNRGNSTTRSGTGSNRSSDNNFSLEDSVSDSGNEIIVRRTMPGAMSHGGGGSAARRKTASIREREHWRRKSKGRRTKKHRRVQVTRPSEVEIKVPISLSELSAATGIKLNNLITTLMNEGWMLTQNMAVPEEALLKVSHEFLVDIQIKKADNLEDDLVQIEKQSEKIDNSKLETRQPVVTIMGHVDHGKTSLLDYIRETKAPVAGSEAGGITQHIGAYVAKHNYRPITFIDTPGHAAFTRMRSRGARITDIVVLVVAADDGIKAQTKEAIAHARAAGVELIVALNKIDKDNADPERALEMLAQEGLQPVEWGGTTEVIKTSAITGQGVDDLLEMVLSIADLHDYKANREGTAFGYVLEGKKTKGRGIVATLLVKDGTLSKGDWIISGDATGRVRMLFNEHGRPMKSAAPGVPVEILGLDEVPSPGDKFHIVEQGDARTLQQQRVLIKEKDQVLLAPVADPTNIFDTIEKQKATRIPIILRADVQGTLEVLKAEVPALSNDEVVLEITQALVGNVTENDIFLAQAQGGLVIAFNVGVDNKASSLAKEQEVEVASFKVIYEMIDFLKQRIEDSLAPEIKEISLGILVCRATFKASRIGQVAGCYVDSGVVRRNSMGRLSRDDIVIWEGDLDSVKRFKEDVKEVREGFECGVKLKYFNDVQVGDVIEVFELQKIKRTLPRD